MSAKIRHDSLQYKSAFYASNCKVDKEKNIIDVGYVFVDNIRANTITVESGTQEKYRILIPLTMQNIYSSHQFNCKFELAEEV